MSELLSAIVFVAVVVVLAVSVAVCVIVLAHLEGIFGEHERKDDHE